MLKGFVSYSHRDKQFLDELKISLKALERAGRAKFWTDQAIDAGDQWHSEIMVQLEAADIAIILLSRYLYASDFVYNVELPRLKEGRDAGKITIVPIRVSSAPEDRIEQPYRWLREEQQIPRDDRVIETAPNNNDIWTEIENELWRTVDGIIERREAGITNSADVEDHHANVRSALQHAKNIVRQVPENLGGVTRDDIERALQTIDEDVLKADTLSQQDATSSADRMLKNLRLPRDEHMGMHLALGALRTELTDMFEAARNAGYPSSTEIGVPAPQTVRQEQVAAAGQRVEERFDELEKRLEELEAERRNVPDNTGVNAATKEITEEIRKQHSRVSTLLGENPVDWVGIKTAVDRSVRAVRRFMRRIPVYGIAAFNGIAQSLSQASDLLERSGKAFEKTARYEPGNEMSSDEDSVPASPDVFTDIEGVTPEMVVVPAGEFHMGSPNNEAGRSDDEGPQHKVKISRAFAVGRFPVIFDEWDKARELGFAGPKLEDKFGRGRQPVINVSWEEAKAYADWLANHSGKPYRLLTEAEWEYACRAGSATRFSFGNGRALFGDGGLGQYAWYARNSGGKTHPVGEKKPNAFGLYDMHGNVWEWVNDWYGYYDNGPQTDPQGPKSGQFRVSRGGSWFFVARGLRSAIRNGGRPGIRNSDLGFRLARTYD